MAWLHLVQRLLQLLLLTLRAFEMDLEMPVALEKKSRQVLTLRATLRGCYSGLTRTFAMEPPELSSVLGSF